MIAATIKQLEGKCHLSMGFEGSLEDRGIDTHGKQPGDPTKAAQAIIDVVRGEGAATGRTIPPFITLGSDTYNSISEMMGEVQTRLDTWKTLTCSTDISK